ncbi:MarR family transcriptional regulator [Actinoplanes sp. NPDC051633]|uniref:MarR family winged helix-turn-helix transcriptional regulator n=1 Tax=Actinoplanes sp. NPDC051633 TaxID=3155670 RepID=UPI0034154DBB
MAHVDPAPEDELRLVWRQLMGLVLDQRWRWTEVAAKLEISQAGLRALLAIDPDEPRPMRELAQAMNCDPSYVTAMVDDLERAGYAERLAAPGDRRVKTVALTPKGRNALHIVEKELLAPPDQLAQLPPAERESLARLLRRALPSHGRPGPPPGDGIRPGRSSPAD